MADIETSDETKLNELADTFDKLRNTLPETSDWPQQAPTESKRVKRQTWDGASLKRLTEAKQSLSSSWNGRSPRSSVASPVLQDHAPSLEAMFASRRDLLRSLAAAVELPVNYKRMRTCLVEIAKTCDEARTSIATATETVLNEPRKVTMPTAYSLTLRQMDDELRRLSTKVTIARRHSPERQLQAHNAMRKDIERLASLWKEGHRALAPVVTSVVEEDFGPKDRFNRVTIENEERFADESQDSVTLYEAMSTPALHKRRPRTTTPTATPVRKNVASGYEIVSELRSVLAERSGNIQQ